MLSIKETSKLIQAFRDARDWQQFHSPKNLACSISIEAAELLEKFQWCGTQESFEVAELQKEEIRQLAVEKMEVYMYTSIHIYIMGPN